MKNLVVGCDGSEPSTRAVITAGELAKQMDAGVTLVYVIPPLVLPIEMDGNAVQEMMDSHREYAQGLLKDACKQLPKNVPAHAEIRDGAPSEELVRAANEHDAAMLVVGNTGRGAAGRLLIGSTADRVVHACRKPVLIVR